MSTDVSAAVAPRRASILERLRRDTAASHARAEAAVKLLHHDVTLADYRAYLSGTARVHAVMAPIIAGDVGLVTMLPDLYARLDRGLSALADLTAMGAESPPAFDLATDRFASPGARLGALYVLEGASLRGRVLLPRIHMRFGDDVPTTFLAGYGDATGRMWKSFTLVLETIGIGYPLRDIVMGASSCFDAHFEALA
jgi:heme oxygenase